MQEVIEELTSSSQRYVHHKRDAVMALVRFGIGRVRERSWVRLGTMRCGGDLIRIDAS